MKRYQRQALKLASEILAQPEFMELRPSKYPPHRWCSLRVINAICHAKRELECRGDRVACGCDSYLEVSK